MGAVLQKVHGEAEGVHVGTFAVDAKAAVLLHNPTLEAAALGEDLPRRHDKRRSAELLRHLHQNVGIIMKGMVGRDEYAGPFVQSLANRLGAANLDRYKALGASKSTAPQRSPQTDEPGREFRIPRPGRSLERLSVHNVPRAMRIDADLSQVNSPGPSASTPPADCMRLPAEVQPYSPTIARLPHTQAQNANGEERQTSLSVGCRNVNDLCDSYRRRRCSPIAVSAEFDLGYHPIYLGLFPSKLPLNAPGFLAACALQSRLSAATFFCCAA